MTINTHLTPPDDAFSAVLWVNPNYAAPTLTFVNSCGEFVRDWVFDGMNVNFALYTALAMSKKLDGRVSMQRSLRAAADIMSYEPPPHGRNPSETPTPTNFEQAKRILNGEE